MTKNKSTCHVIPGRVSLFHSRMKLSIGIIFCFLILGVNSQGWGSFIKQAAQGKGHTMGGRLHLAGTWSHLAELTSSLGKGATGSLDVDIH